MLSPGRVWNLCAAKKRVTGWSNRNYSHMALESSESEGGTTWFAQADESVPYLEDHPT